MKNQTKKNIYTGLLMVLLGTLIAHSTGPSYIADNVYMVIKYIILAIGLYMLVELRKL